MKGDKKDTKRYFLGMCAVSRCINLGDERLLPEVKPQPKSSAMTNCFFFPSFTLFLFSNANSALDFPTRTLTHMHIDR